LNRLFDARGCSVPGQRLGQRLGCVGNMFEDWHSLGMADIVHRLGTDLKEGLNSDQVRSAKREFGPNELAGGKRITVAALLFSQLKEFLIILLIAAAIVSALVGEAVDSIVIVAIVVLSVVSSVVQELKAERSIEALKRMTVSSARVVRSGREQRIDASGLVPGDIIVLEAGDRVTADARIVEAVDLRADESLLTGESTPVEKRAIDSLDAGTSLGDRANMLFSSTTVLTGRAHAVAVATGMRTEVGKIASMMTELEQEETPLQRRLAVLGKRLGAIAICVCAVIFLIGVVRGIEIFEMFMTSISLAVAAVPEGLPAIVTVVLALGVQRMSRENAIIRRLSAVETLGSATVICSDKTGTLTQNKMTVRKVVTFDAVLDVPAEESELCNPFGAERPDADSSENRGLKRLIEASVLCNNSSLEVPKQGPGLPGILGDPTEGALLILGLRCGLRRDELLSSYPRIAEIPFDSDRKRMTTVHSQGDTAVAYIKGAFDSVIELSSRHLVRGEERPLDDRSRGYWRTANDELAGSGMRVLAVAMKRLSDAHVYRGQPLRPEEVESSLTFIGLAAMIDPPRDEALLAVERCKAAGIIPVMITGDHASTASAIAREIGILEGSGQVLGGTELDSMPDDEFLRDILRFRVYSRVSPHHKMKIVTALQKSGEIVAMTGDGVNDAPALKKADIGVAMGVTGTDVAKEASDMVLADDNFATIVNAVEEGRVIFDNIRKAVYYLVSCNAGELIVILSAIVIGLSRPLEAIQILWVNLVTDGPPALALGVETGDPDTMQRPPRDPGEGVFTRDGVWTVFGYGLCMGALTLIGYYVGSRCWDSASVAVGRTMAFGVLVFAQLFHAFNIRCGIRSVFSRSPLENRLLLLSVAASAALQSIVMLYPPVMRVFKTSALVGSQWATVIGLAAAMVPAAEGVKWILRIPDRKKRTSGSER
jgi:Ca2+-transporting ATPase